MNRIMRSVPFARKYREVEDVISVEAITMSSRRRV